MTLPLVTVISAVKRLAACAALAMGLWLGAAAVGPAGPAQAKTAFEIEAGVDAALAELFRLQPNIRELYKNAYGVLVLPDIVKAGFIVGGSYGEGGLVIDGAIDSYWSMWDASVGFQAGAQRTRQAIFFMTPSALTKFRANDTGLIGAEAEVTVIDSGGEVGVDTSSASKPVIVINYSRQGLLGGASIRGGRFKRIAPF